MRNILAIFIIVGLFSCSKQVDKNDELIINEIFNELTVRMCLYNNVSSDLLPPPPPPPPPPPRSNCENDSLKRADSIDYRESIEIYLRKIEEQKLDGDRIILSIGDSLIPYHENDLNYLKRNIPSKAYFSAFNSLRANTYKSKHLDITLIQNTGKFELRYLSTFYPLKNVWERKREYQFSGFLQLSRIYLDEKKQHGIFYCSYSCGHLCGHGDYIFIKKLNGKWTIDKTIGVWIS